MSETGREAFLPRISPEAEFFWNGLRRHELLYQVCGDCGESIFHPRALCPYCLAANLRIERSAGAGTVYSFSVIHHANVPAFASDVPYAVGIVELDEGFHMFTRLLADDPNTIAIGQRVVVEYLDTGHEVTLPAFRSALVQVR